MNNFHILAIPHDRSLHSIRDLRSTDVVLLEYILDKTYKILCSKCNIKSSDLRVAFHYRPSTWHLHIHFTLLKQYDKSSCIDFSHNAIMVMENIRLNSEHYKQIRMPVLNNY